MNQQGGWINTAIVIIIIMMGIVMVGGFKEVRLLTPRKDPQSQSNTRFPGIQQSEGTQTIQSNPVASPTSTQQEETISTNSAQPTISPFSPPTQ